MLWVCLGERPGFWLGDRKISAVSASELKAHALGAQSEAVRRSNSRNGSSARENRVAAMRACFRCAVDEGLLDVNPADGVVKPAASPAIVVASRKVSHWPSMT
jgi:site-specific recombinase XerC